MGLTGDFSAQYDPGTLGMYITKDQGTADIGENYPAATVQNSAPTQISVSAPSRPDRGTFDVYVSALDNGTPVYSNPQPITYTYDPEIIT